MNFNFFPSSFILALSLTPLTILLRKMYPDTTSVFHPVNNDISTLEIAKRKLRKYLKINTLTLIPTYNIFFYNAI